MFLSRLSVNRSLAVLIGFLAVSAIYLYAFPQANVFYAVVVFLHVLAGVAASILYSSGWCARGGRPNRWFAPECLSILLGAIRGWC